MIDSEYLLQVWKEVAEEFVVFEQVQVCMQSRPSRFNLLSDRIAYL